MDWENPSHTSLDEFRKKKVFMLITYSKLIIQCFKKKKKTFTLLNAQEDKG